MPNVIHNPLGQKAFVFSGLVSGYAASLALIPFVPDGGFDAICLVMGAFCFVMAIFLPEQADYWDRINNLRSARFCCRQSMLGLMAYGIFTACMHRYVLPVPAELVADSEPGLFPLFFVILSYGAYFVALMFVRGLRAGPEPLPEVKTMDQNADKRPQDEPVGQIDAMS